MLHRSNIKKRKRLSSARTSSLTLTKDLLHSKSTYFYHGGNNSSSRKKLSHSLSSKLTYVVPSVCGLAFLVGLGVAINPAIGSSLVHAESSSGDVEPSISISFPTTGLPEGYTNDAVETTPVVPGVVAYRSNYFDVTVKNPSWYAVSVRAAKGYTSELKNGEASIVGVGENVLPANFKENTWGYALTKVPTTDTVIDDATLEYNTLPDENSVLAQSAGYLSDEEKSSHYKVSFATLFSGDIPSGHYATKVYVSAVTDPGRVTGLPFGTGTMQALAENPSLCANVPEDTTGRLADERDGKMYWVAKLADGNCWMTQNLDFDLKEGTKLTTADSDVKSDKTISKTDGSGSNTIVKEITSLAGWTTANITSSTAAYYDPGDYVYTVSGGARLSSNSCDNITDGFNNAKCSTYFQKVSDVVNYVESQNLHYHVGNYYSWDAATINSKSGRTGSSTYNASNNTTESICPKGWKLPTGNNDENGSFQYLFGDGRYNWINASTKVEEIGPRGIYGEPLYFLYSGYLYSGKLNGAGWFGDNWTSTPGSNIDDVYIIDFNATVNLSTSRRSNGFPVRCLLRAS